MKFLYTYLALPLVFFSCQKSTSPSPLQVIPASSAPTIIKISPTSGVVNSLVTITGTNFNPLAAADTVKFNGVIARVRSASDSTLIVQAPNGGTTGIVTVTTGSGLASGPGFAYGPNVYVAGYERYGEPGVALTKYWKNGEPVILIPESSYGYAYGIAVSDTNVYVAGIEENSGGKFQARYWNNGVIHRLSEGTSSSQANAVTIAGNDVYVAGLQYTDEFLARHVAVIWKNDVADTLPNDTSVYNTSMQATGIVVAGNDVYASGWVIDAQHNYPNAIYWKNGVGVALPSPPQADAYGNSIAVNGNDVYVAGYEYFGYTTAIIWKNGVRIPLTDVSTSSVANAIIVAGNDVYVAGNEYNGSHYVATYWKNGSAIALTNGTTDASATSITVFGSDVYVAGYESNIPANNPAYDPDLGHVVKYWKNGIAVQLGTGLTRSEGNAIFVK